MLIKSHYFHRKHIQIEIYVRSGEKAAVKVPLLTWIKKCNGIGKPLVISAQWWWLNILIICDIFTLFLLFLCTRYKKVNSIVIVHRILRVLLMLADSNKLCRTIKTIILLKGVNRILLTAI